MTTTIAADPDTRSGRISAAPLIGAAHRAGIVLDSLPWGARRAFYRAQEEGTLTRRAADSFACHVLHEHPALIWGHEWWDVR